MAHKLIRVPDDMPGSIYFHFKHPSHQIYLGVLPTMFGYRIVVHENDGCWIPVSFCGGADQQNVQKLFSIMYKIVAVWQVPRCPNIRDFPRERRRPWGNDPAFQKALRKMAGSYELIEIPPLHLFRIAQTLTLFVNEETAREVLQNRTNR